MFSMSEKTESEVLSLAESDDSDSEVINKDWIFRHLPIFYFMFNQFQS
jgi:hypothetical protein